MDISETADVKAITSELFEFGRFAVKESIGPLGSIKTQAGYPNQLRYAASLRS